MRRVKKNPTRSIAAIARETGLTRSTASRIVKSAGGQSLRRKKCPLLSASARERRLEHCIALLNDLKSAVPQRIIFFSDEKNFVVDPCFNPQNDQYIRIGGPVRRDPQAEDQAGDADEGPRPEYLPRTKKPASLMFLGVVASTGEVCPPIWFPEGFRLKSADYIAVLAEKVIPWMLQIASNHARPFCFQQDGAPAQTARATVNFLNEEGIDFWGPTMWPPCSPDANPLDYAIWSYVQQEA